MNRALLVNTPHILCLLFFITASCAPANRHTSAINAAPLPNKSADVPVIVYSQMRPVSTQHKSGAILIAWQDGRIVHSDSIDEPGKHLVLARIPVQAINNAVAIIRDHGLCDTTSYPGPPSPQFIGISLPSSDGLLHAIWYPLSEEHAIANATSSSAYNDRRFVQLQLISRAVAHSLFTHDGVPVDNADELNAAALRSVDGATWPPNLKPVISNARPIHDK